MKLKTLKDFQDEVAQREGHTNFDELTQFRGVVMIEMCNEQVAELYAEYMAIEFAEFIDKNCDSEIEAGYGYKNKTYSRKELYNIFREENK